MKQTRLNAAIASAALALALAAGLAGCAAEAPTQSSAASSDATATSSAVQTEAASGASSSAASSDDAAASSAPAQREEPSANTSQQDDTAQTTNDTQGGRQGGMMGGGMDTAPGQTNEKGFIANDNGIAITDTLTASEAFTERDLEQNPDTAGATSLSVADGRDITISEDGVYVISGSANESTIVVEADETAKVQLVLDGVSITNTNFPAIYVKSADKVFVTLKGDNALSVTGDFTADEDTNTDAVIFSKDDLCLNGTGSLAINSTDHAVVSKDDLKVTGGTYTIKAAGNGLRGDDSVRIAGGTFTIDAEDGIKAKNDEDNEKGYIYVADGTFTINGTDNGIQGYAFVWIDGGTFDITGEECIEGTYIQINGGKIDIESSDDGINASIKSSVYTPTIDITGGEVTINMAAGDTDALDSNGYLYISGGTLNLNAQSPFDYAWGAEMTGGTVYVNGEQVTEIYESMMGGGGMSGGMGGQRPDGDFGGRERPDDMGGGQQPDRQRPDGPGGMGDMQPPSDGQAPVGDPFQAPTGDATAA